MDYIDSLLREEAPGCFANDAGAVPLSPIPRIHADGYRRFPFADLVTRLPDGGAGIVLGNPEDASAVVQLGGEPLLMLVPGNRLRVKGDSAHGRFVGPLPEQTAIGRPHRTQVHLNVVHAFEHPCRPEAVHQAGAALGHADAAPPIRV